MYSEIVGNDASRRSDVEAFIRDRYWCAYRARLETYPERLFAVFSDQGEPIAAAGFRTEEDGFFSESYLDNPLEVACAQALNQPIGRSSLLEICNLASISSHAVFPLMSGLLAHGRDRGFSYGLFTATGRLRNVFQRLKVPFEILAPATSLSMDEPDKWGTYFDTDPRVCLMPNPTDAAASLFPRAHALARPSGQETVKYG